MSGKALKDFNTLPVSERKSDSFSITKTCKEQLNENLDNGQKKNPAFIKCDH
ncbi:hypothetical protein ACHQM5_018189 [Ranunculus cassubicifolius]